MALSYLEHDRRRAASRLESVSSPERVLLEARLNIETGALATAASLLDEFIESDPGVRYIQAAGILAFSARKAMGERKAAVRHLRAVVAAAPDTRLGRDATVLIEGLAAQETEAP